MNPATPRYPRTTRGLTIVEALIAIAILAVAMAAIIPAFTNNARINSQQELRSGAVAAAQLVLDNLRVRSWSSWPTSQSVDAGSHTFDVAIAICTEGASGCFTTTDARHVELEVSNDDTTYYTVETVFTRFE